VEETKEQAYLWSQESKEGRAGRYAASITHIPEAQTRQIGLWHSYASVPWKKHETENEIESAMKFSADKTL
jgi:hypothetical protein